jgi:cell division protein FtsB
VGDKLNFSETISSAKTTLSDKEFHALLLRWARLNRWGIILIIFLSSVFSIFYIANIMNVNNTLSELREMKKYRENLINKNKLLLTRIEALESPERIDYLAGGKLGMVKPDKAPFFIQSNNKNSIK